MVIIFRERHTHKLQPFAISNMQGVKWFFIGMRLMPASICQILTMMYFLVIIYELLPKPILLTNKSALFDILIIYNYFTGKLRKFYFTKGTRG